MCIVESDLSAFLFKHRALEHSVLAVRSRCFRIQKRLAVFRKVIFCHSGNSVLTAAVIDRLGEISRGICISLESFEHIVVIPVRVHIHFLKTYDFQIILLRQFPQFIHIRVLIRRNVECTYTQGIRRSLIILALRNCQFDDTASIILPVSGMLPHAVLLVLHISCRSPIHVKSLCHSIALAPICHFRHSGILLPVLGYENLVLR